MPLTTMDRDIDGKPTAPGARAKLDLVPSMYGNVAYHRMHVDGGTGAGKVLTQAMDTARLLTLTDRPRRLTYLDDEDHSVDIVFDQVEDYRAVKTALSKDKNLLLDRSGSPSRVVVTEEILPGAPDVVSFPPTYAAQKKVYDEWKASRPEPPSGSRFQPISSRSVVVDGVGSATVKRVAEVDGVRDSHTREYELVNGEWKQRGGSHDEFLLKPEEEMAAEGKGPNFVEGSKQPAVFYPNDNGGRPFKVVIKPTDNGCHTVEIWKGAFGKEEAFSITNGVMVETQAREKVFGDDRGPPVKKGRGLVGRVARLERKLENGGQVRFAKITSYKNGIYSGYRFNWGEDFDDEITTFDKGFTAKVSDVADVPGVELAYNIASCRDLKYWWGKNTSKHNGPENPDDPKTATSSPML